MLEKIGQKDPTSKNGLNETTGRSEKVETSAKVIAFRPKEEPKQTPFVKEVLRKIIDSIKHLIVRVRPGEIVIEKPETPKKPQVQKGKNQPSDFVKEVKRKEEKYRAE